MAVSTSAIFIIPTGAQVPKDSSQVLLSAVEAPAPDQAQVMYYQGIAPEAPQAIEAVPPQPVTAPPKPADGPRTRQIQMTVTAYCPCARCCGPQACGVTASGRNVRANHSRFVAADTRVLPFHTRLSIPGYDGGQAVPVLDCGGAIKGHRLDVFFPTHQQAIEWGVQRLTVTVYES